MEIIVANTLSNDSVCSSESLLTIPTMTSGLDTTSTAAAVDNVGFDVKDALPLSKDASSQIPSLPLRSTDHPPENGISVDNEVDSALLCAMRDPRERVSLLRLEQSMIDFMNTDAGYIQVGGPNNSVVIYPTLSQENQRQTAAGRQQTSFQRCWLHRLADRFQIIRETQVDGMIRLIKVKESSIPSKLLIDLQPCDYDEPHHAQEVRVLATKLSDTSIGKSGKQMKIMKRSSSGLGSCNSLKGKDRLSSRNRTNLSDKEKAYAEARARIFNNSSSSDSTSTTDVNKTTSQPTSPDECPTASPDAPPSLEQSQNNESYSEDSERISKATWRNRRQEEADPDFYRLTSASHAYSVDATYSATALSGTVPHVYGGYAQQQQQQQQYYIVQQQEGSSAQQSYEYEGGYEYTAATPTYGHSYETEVYQQQQQQYVPLKSVSSSPYGYSHGSVRQGGQGGGGLHPRSSPTRDQGQHYQRQADVSNMDEFPSLT